MTICQQRNSLSGQLRPIVTKLRMSEPRLPIPVFRNPFLDPQNPFLQGSLRISFSPCFFLEEFLHMNMVLEESWKLLFSAAFTGIFCRPEQRSALRAIHSLNTPKIISNCSGGRYPSICCVSTRRNASCGALSGHFRPQRTWLWLWWCFAVCRSTNHFFRLNHGIVGIPRKLLSYLEQDDSCIVLRQRRKDKREKKRNGIQTSTPNVGMLII